MKTYFISFFLIVILINQVTAQTNGQAPAGKKTIRQDLAWLRYHNKIRLADRWEWQTHFDKRFYISPVKQHQYLLRTQVFYEVQKKLSLSQGFVYLLQSPHDPEDASRFSLPEYRPFQEAVIKNDIGRAQIRHRYRLEERFIHKADSREEILLPGYHFSFRARYQFQVQFPLLKITEEKKLNFRISEEVMLNFGKNIVYNTFDQSRFSAAFLYSISKALEVEAGYSHWYQQRADGKSYFNRHIWRATVFHSVDLRKR